MSSRAAGSGGPVLLGRAEECAVVDGMLGQARAGSSGVLLVSGEPGVGKSALLEYGVASASASGFEVVRAAGVRPEMELAFAGLQQLCAPLLDGLAELPGPQRAAIETAFGVSAGVPPDPFFVGLGVLGLLAAAARPLLCVVDDVQWLDQASARALGFAVRRLQADPVAVLLAGRQAGELGGAAGLAEVRLAGLADADARALLAPVLPRWADQKVIDRIVAETAGNPLALLELPRGMSPAELAGGSGFGGTPGGLPGRIEESFGRRLELLPEPARRLVLLAAADSSGDAALLWRAGALAGIDPGAAGPAQDAGLVQVGARVRFFHPLVRSAVLRAASAQERRAAHGVLAAATDAAADPGRRAWHRAQAAAGPDEQVAGELEACAEGARARGGVAAAAAFLERAAALTLDPERRSARALAAAQAWHQAGGHDRAAELADVAEAGPLDELGRAQAGWLRAQIIFVRTDGRDGAAQLLRAARRLGPLDRDLARATYIDAMWAAFVSGDLEAGRQLRTLPLSQPPAATELLLHGYGLFVTDGFPHGADALGQAIDAFVTAPVTGDENIRALEAAAAVARARRDDTGFDVLTARVVALTRQAGALSLLPEALDIRALYCVDAGELAGAAAALDEAEAIRQATGIEPGFGGDSGLLAALRDEEPAATGHIEQLRRDPRIGGVSPRAAMLEHALAVLYNGLARYPEALAAAQRSSERYPGGGGTIQALPELIEAAVRCHQPETAQTALQALRAHTRTRGTDWGLGVEARSRALLAGGAAAEQLYAEAIGRLDRTRMRLPLARAHLLYGEWLRRQRRRTDARAQLRTAHDLFEAIGARSFAGRARQELTATGATAHSRRNATLDELTPQEARIASLAGEGLSNPEIAARLYISKGTVDYHLIKVFRKLGIRSRAQLHRALAPATARS